MYNIAICIPTYKRPLMLEKLVLSIVGCKFDESTIKDVKILIVDNDVEKTAERTINALKEKFNDSHKIEYLCHPAKGISNVRNELIKKALLSNPDFIVFVDDDEYVVSEWLNELIKTLIINDADAVRGPVLAKFDKKIPDYVSYWFKRESYPNNYQLDTFTTGNLILKRASLQKYNIWFDSRFNVTGAGDYYFGIQLLKKGARIFWAANAITYETIPESRANIKWLIKRYYRGASTYMWVMKLEKQYMKLVKKILVSLVYIISGILALIILPFPIEKRYWGILTITEGIGGITGLFSVLYLEYK